jgi:hypothetical protein
MVLMSQFYFFPFATFSKENPIPGGLDRNQDLSLSVSASRPLSLFSLPATILLRLAQWSALRLGAWEALDGRLRKSIQGLTMSTSSHTALPTLPALLDILPYFRKTTPRMMRSKRVFDSLASKNLL